MTQPTTLEASRSTRGAQWTVRSFTVVIAISLIGGIAAAIGGGSLTELGSGAGGLFGVPSILTTLIALVALATAVVASRQARRSPGWLNAAIVIAGGAWIIAIGYFMVAHTLDPCVNGWWDSGSRIGHQPLCERFGSELNWHTRFHLLAHAAPGAGLLALYLGAIRRWAMVPGATAR